MFWALTVIFSAFADDPPTPLTVITTSQETCVAASFHMEGMLREQGYPQPWIDEHAVFYCTIVLTENEGIVSIYGD